MIMTMMSEFKCKKSKTTYPVPRVEKNSKSQPVHNKMQIIVFTCQDNIAHEENMGISLVTYRKKCDNLKAFSKNFYECNVQDEGNHVVNGRGCKENIFLYITY